MAKASAQNSFELLYIKQKRLSTILGVVSGLLAVALVVILVLHPTLRPRTASQQRPPFGAGGQMAQGMQRNLDVSSFIKSDGSIDTDRIKDLTSRIPADFKSPLMTRVETKITQAKKDGKISTTQAAQLRAAFGVGGTT